VEGCSQVAVEDYPGERRLALMERPGSKARRTSCDIGARGSDRGQRANSHQLGNATHYDARNTVGQMTITRTRFST
jgi:hypothetical protein